MNSALLHVTVNVCLTLSKTVIFDLKSIFMPQILEIVIFEDCLLDLTCGVWKLETSKYESVASNMQSDFDEILSLSHDLAFLYEKMLAAHISSALLMYRSDNSQKIELLSVLV